MTYHYQKNEIKVHKGIRGKISQRLSIAKTQLKVGAKSAATELGQRGKNTILDLGAGFKANLKDSLKNGLKNAAFNSPDLDIGDMGLDFDLPNLLDDDED